MSDQRTLKLGAAPPWETQSRAPHGWVEVYLHAARWGIYHEPCGALLMVHGAPKGRAMFTMDGRYIASYGALVLGTFDELERAKDRVLEEHGLLVPEGAS